MGREKIKGQHQSKRRETLYEEGRGSGKPYRIRRKTEKRAFLND